MKMIGISIKRNFQTLETRLALGTVILLLALHYIQVMIQTNGWDENLMVHFLKLRTLNDSNIFGAILVQALPVIGVLAGGFSYFRDKKAGEVHYWIAKAGSRKYYLSKYIAAFLTGLIVVGVPLLGEILWYAIAFPTGANGDIYMSRFSEGYEDMVMSYLFSGLYMKSRLAYGLLMAIMVAVVAGVFAAFTVSLSMTGWFKIRILLLFPVYLLFSLSYYIGILLNVEYETYWSYYLYYYNTSEKSEGFLGACMLALIAISIIPLIYRCRKGEIG